MMDSDLSFLEIAGEDDSLLQIPRQDSGVNSTSTIFSCSPLHCLRSVPALAPQTEGRVGAVDLDKLNYLPKNGKNKENMNENKSDALKLNVETQQMKRKKKGGGYNLRKSLAWDRAFFTEEGVLNPLELSMISGNHSTTSNELTIIHEDDDALVGDGDTVGTSSLLHDIEENLFKQLPEDRKIGACLSPAPNALTKDTPASAFPAKRKVLAVDNINRNRSKRDACPRRIASSSLKRPDPLKAQSKESKISKLPVLNAHVPAITTARSGALSTGYSKRNQNAHSAAYVQKNAGVKGLPKNLNSVPINGKVDAADKCSVTKSLKRQAGKNIDDSILEVHPPSRLQHQLVAEANEGLEVHPPLRIGNTGDKKQLTQLQTAKPSGLRMPSPSLGFFSQQKAASLHSILHKSSKPCKPPQGNDPKLKNIMANCSNEARHLHTLRKSSEIVNVKEKNCTPNLSLADVKSGPSLKVENNKKAKVEVQCYSLGSGEKAEQEKVETIPMNVKNKSPKQVQPCKSENVLFMKNMEFLTNDVNLLVESDMDDHLKTKVNQDQFQEPQSTSYSSIQRTSRAKDDSSNIAQNAIEHEVDVPMKPFKCDAQISKVLVPQTENCTSSKDNRHSREFKEYNCMKIAPVNSNLGDFSETVLGISREGIPYKSNEEVKDGVGDFYKYEVDAPGQLLNVNLFSEAVNQHLKFVHGLNEGFEEQTETMKPSIVGEINLKSNCESHMNGCLVHWTTLLSQQSPKKPLLEVIGSCESASRIAEIEDRRYAGNVQSDSIHRRSVDDEYDQLIDSKMTRDRTKASSKLDRMLGDCICQMEQAACGSQGNDMPANNSCDIHELQFRDDSSSRGTSLHRDLFIAQHDLLGNLDQKARMLTSSKTDFIHSDNETSVANYSLLLDESNSFEASTNISSENKDFTKGGAKTPSGLRQHKLLAEAITETDDAKRLIEILHMTDATVLSSDENLVTCSCNNNPSTSVGKDQFPIVADSINKESFLELQRPGLVADVEFLHVNLNGDLLPASDACSEEIRCEILFEGVLEQSSNYASKDITSKHDIQATPEIKDGNIDLDERAERLQMDGADKVSNDNVEVDTDHKVHEADVVSSIQGNESQIMDVDWICKERCSLSGSSKSLDADNLISHRQIPQSSEAGSLKRRSFSEEAGNSPSEKDKICSANVQNQILEDSGERIHLKKSGTETKQNVPTVIPPPNVAPFSDEWLAAMEAAGEEILTMKSGAVQNSPTDKLQHEPGPWSPVRRRNQTIGPFDCTKCTNTNISDSC